MHGVLDTLVDGAVAGAVATVPMSGVMLAAGEAGAMGRQPPRLITDAALDAAGVEQPSEAASRSAAAAAHVGFGTAAGAVFALLQATLRPRTSPVVNGVAFGLAVWALSYEGWVPALGIMPRPEDDRDGRPQSMIAAHIVYGAVLGALVGRQASASA
jgi:hypothetical protein